MSVAKIEVYKREKAQMGMNPKKFVLWLFLVTVTMLFAAFTSAMIVRRADGNWTYFQVPLIFTASTIAIGLSSISMHWAYISAKKDEIVASRRGMFITIVLGIAFGFLQRAGYIALVNEHVFLVGNPSGSFFYVISWIHLLHVVGGVLGLSWTLYKSYKFKVHSRNILGINLITTYWHFIGGLWIYLFAILNLLR